MKIVEHFDILSKGRFATSKTWKKACSDIETAIIATDWPHGAGKFTIYPESGKKRGQGNGVVPIKKPCIKKLKKLGWKAESLPKIAGGVLGTGDLDALYESEFGYIGFEWETGNISSSHRAINKILLALQREGIKGGVLVVPSNNMKYYLTDRIGNIGELRPYFPLWKTIDIREGVFRIIVVEHDETSVDVPKIPKGKDGRAKE
ncbi:MAG: hypothetical protein NTW38_10885 [Candidatus Aminicenantes bacterium]|nr:hypothetical protein [Candidatus Aminicenantes bacterium]